MAECTTTDSTTTDGTTDGTTTDGTTGGIKTTWTFPEEIGGQKTTRTVTAMVFLRPGYEDFLTHISEIGCEIYICTAADYYYAHTMLRLLEKHSGVKFSGIWTRHDLFKDPYGSYLKPISLIANVTATSKKLPVTYFILDDNHCWLYPKNKDEDVYIQDVKQNRELSRIWCEDNRTSYAVLIKIPMFSGEFGDSQLKAYDKCLTEYITLLKNRQETH